MVLGLDGPGSIPGAAISHSVHTRSGKTEAPYLTGKGGLLTWG
jgi:hypothetical protein